MKPIIMPKTEHPITGNVFVDRFVEYVRKHNYPAFIEDYIAFIVDGEYELAMCSDLTMSMEAHESTFECIRRGLHDEDEQIGVFDGGMYSVRYKHDVMVLVDGYLYFFDF